MNGGSVVGEVILTMKGIDKSFPGVHALDHVDLEIRRGEVHALMGENGAGKSTLMKVLTGIYSKDSGTITYEGREVEFHSPKEAQDAGIVIVHQELNMMGHLTVAQNIFIGREPRSGLFIKDAAMNAEARKLFQQFPAWNVFVDVTHCVFRFSYPVFIFLSVHYSFSFIGESVVFTFPHSSHLFPSSQLYIHSLLTVERHPSVPIVVKLSFLFPQFIEQIPTHNVKNK
jgi:ribose transport system ATP-binding protein